MRAGDVLADRFEIERPVAIGGMGRIYRARDRWSGEVVAVKVLAQPRARALDRFLREAMVLAEIQHPGIVRYVAHGRTGDRSAYLVMEWLEGEDLSRYLKRQASASPPLSEATIVDPRAPVHEDTSTGPDTGTHTISWSVASLAAETAPSAPSAPPAPSRDRPQPTSGHRLSIEQTVVLGRRLASAVAELHRRGIVHRDIKPANLFLPGKAIESLKVLDLGVARRQSLGESVSEIGALVGTPHYMAPEQASSSADIGPAADVWAIGCVLYQCLTGERPFVGSDAVAVLARIVMEHPVPLQALRDDVPTDLAALIMRTLEKRPGNRPADAGVLLELLDGLGSADRILRASRRRSSQRMAVAEGGTLPGALTEHESRVTCMLLADAPGVGSDDPGVVWAMQSSGCEVQRLAQGTLLVTVPGMHPPTDQASRAAHAALALRRAVPGVRMALATGRAEGQNPLGQVLDEAAEALRAVAPGSVRVDARTAALLDTRFDMVPGSGGLCLGEERSLSGARILLGKPTPWVGRQQEMAMLMATFVQCIDDEVARVVLVTGPAGMGKSRLRHEFLQAVRARQDEVVIIHGRGDLVSAGSPFVMIGPALRDLAGIVDGEPVEVCRAKLRARIAQTVPVGERERVTLFLGELAGVPFPAEHSESLTAARKDPMLMGQLMQMAWEDWLRAECDHRPMVLVLEDLHWGDLPSVRYVDGALRSLYQRPILVLALARSEVSSVFPRLWERHRPQEIRLSALSHKASAQLARAILGPDVSEHVIDSLAWRADGNAFYLEELIRAAAQAQGSPGGPGSPSSRDGEGSLPETVVGMVQARLHALSPEAKRILRAASVFGEMFWEGGVSALSGETGAFEVYEWIDELVARELVVRQPSSRVPGEAAYAFRHALVRDAAYAMLTEEDRCLGHALAGAWLEQAGERDGRILAEHFLRGEQHARAVPHLLRAAEQALEGNDLDAVIELAERGVAAGARDVILGRLRTLESIASYWQSDYAASERHGMAAAALLQAGSAPWFAAMGCAMVSNARLGKHERVAELLEVAAVVPSEPGAEAEQLICLCRSTFQLLFNGRYAQADEVLARITALAQATEQLDALTSAQVHHLQSLRSALAGDIPTTLHHLATAIDAFERAGDIRNVALERTSLAWWWAELGYAAHAAKLCEDNLLFCQQQNALQAITFTKVNLGFILSQCEGRASDARRVLDEAIAECREVGNLRLEGWAHVNMAALEHAAGQHVAEERSAARALTLLEGSPSFLAWALAVHTRALLALGRADEALGQARRAMDLLERVGDIIHGRALPPLTLAQALHATGDLAAARTAIVAAAERIAHRASYFREPEQRERFLAKPDNRQTLSLAWTWAGWTMPAP